MLSPDFSPAKIETSGIFEGYSYRERAYRVRVTKPGAVTVRLRPTRPIVSPVLRLYFAAPPSRVRCNGADLTASEFRCQQEGEDLVIWFSRTLDSETTIEIVPG